MFVYQNSSLVHGYGLAVDLILYNEKIKNTNDTTTKFSQLCAMPDICLGYDVSLDI